MQFQALERSAGDWPAWDEAEAAEIVARLRYLPGATIPMLHALQDRFGHVPQAAVALIADTLNLSRAEVHGVLTFYHDFRHAPPGRHVVKLCRAEACQAVGARDLEAHAQRRIGAFGTTRADGAVTLEPAYCLGNCALGPAMLVDGTLHGRVDPARFDRVIGALA